MVKYRQHIIEGINAVNPNIRTAAIQDPVELGEKALRLVRITLSDGSETCKVFDTDTEAEEIFEVLRTLSI